MRNILFFVLLALITLAPAAQAGPLNFYVGGSVGEGGGLDADDFGAFLDDFDIDDSDSVWKIFAGLSLGRLIGVEAAWHDLGTVNCCDGLADAGFSLDVEGISAAVVVGISISRLHLFAKGGLFSWKVDGDLLSIIGPLPVSEDGEDLMGGVGADLRLTKHFFVRAEYELFQVDDSSLDTVSLGVQYKF